MVDYRWIGNRMLGMHSRMQRIAFYDMDKTITQRATWTAFLTAYARNGRHRPWLIAGTIGPVILYLAKRIDRATLKERTQAIVMGASAPRATVESVADAFAADVVARNVRADALARIAADRAAGYRIVLATASYDFYVRAIAARLGIADVIATPSTVAGDRVIARIAGRNCYGPAKLAMVGDWMAAQGIARDDAHIRFYSDHVSDAPALDWADEGVAVSPHGPLRRLAAARGWRIEDWR